MKWGEGESKQDYEAIRHIAEEMQQTVTQLMDLSRVDSGEVELNVESVSLGEMVEQIWGRHQSMAVERGLQVDLGDFEGVIWDVDRSMFERIVDNLIENAVSYTTEGGRIEVGVSEDQSALIVSNSCEDLVDEDMEKLFQRFWRKDSSRSSSMHRGLGLSVGSAYAQCLGMGLEASLIDGNFQMRLAPG